MTTIDEKTLKDFKKDFKETVVALEKKYGISIKAKKITYFKDSFSMVVEAAVSSGNKEADQRRAFEKLCARYGFQKDDYGAEFTYQDKELRFIGFDSRKRKNVCVVLETANNTSFVCSADFVKRMISKNLSTGCDCEHCKNAVCRIGAYTGTQFIECGLRPDEDYYMNHPEELDWSIRHPEEAEKKYCCFVSGIPKKGDVTFDD